MSEPSKEFIKRLNDLQPVPVPEGAADFGGDYGPDDEVEDE